MKKFIFPALLSVLSGTAITNAQNNNDAVINRDGVDMITYTYAGMISRDGNKIVGASVDGGTVYYNRATKDLYYYAYGDYGRGYVVSNNGWVVGTQQIDDGYNKAVIMADGKMWTPPFFNTSQFSSNIHSITPDGSRICGVVGGDSKGYTNLPFYMDIDENGNLGEIQYLPFPDKDFFGRRPQYCSATWLSEDGKTIAGQVIDWSGFFVYPILYKQEADGTWNYSLPSQSQFNPKGKELPKPVGDFEDEFPEAVFPEVQNFMSVSEYLKFESDGSPYDELEKYMTPEQYQAYWNATEEYIIYQEEYEKIFQAFTQKVWEIADESVFYVRNNMALSADGKWLAASAEVDDLSNPEYPVGYYVPYRCNLETGEWIKLSKDRSLLSSNQVLPNGDVVCSSLPDDIIPARTWIYQSEKSELVSLYDYIASTNEQYKNWYDNNLTGDIPVGINPDGTYVFESITITGKANISDDFTVIAGGVDMYPLGEDMYATYIFDNLISGVEEIAEELPADGVYNVYNMQGVKVLTTKNADELKNLARGIYIINGKKAFLK